MNERNIPFFRLNTEDLMLDYTFSWKQTDNDLPQLKIEDKSNGKNILNTEILSVWYRKPDVPLNLPYFVNEEVDRHNKVEARQFFIYLMHYLSDIYSIGNHLYDKRANSKMVQSRLAVKLGMTVADTCFTNNKEEAINFANRYPYIAIKSLHDHWMKNEDGKVYDLMTQKVSSNLLSDQPREAFEQSPLFLQQYIQKKYELRITVMGPYIFTCKLHSQLLTESTGAIDWRQGYEYGLKHEIIDTPQELASFCKKYLRNLNLNFGCFDFIVTPKDEYIFLECNPNGQWGWIEDECKIPMSEALIDCLLNRLKV